jgi:ubiquinone/menaquinone biosynthesis C-methylase UbiE
MSANEAPGAGSVPRPQIIRVHEALTCCDPAWEEAYLRFETPQQEITKFRRRLQRLGASQWPREATIVELFCGRGNALHAWQQLGFCRLEGVDLSDRLLRQYRGNAQLYVCDARELVFDSASRDIVAVQGGLHHLEQLPRDLDRTLAEVARVLRPNGLFVAVEPWLTPFLSLVHALSEIKLVRRAMPRFDAFAIMTERERDTYENWLRNRAVVLALLRKYFEPRHLRMRLGKLEFVGCRRD